MRLVFGTKEIALWEAALDNQPRAISESEWAAATIPQIEAFKPSILNAGILFRFRTRDHGDFDFEINPVAARHLAISIVNMGQEVGWLNAEGNIILPPRPPLDA
ncbi:MAG: hypothetical protein GC182_08690 [Rhodopseudomonas sp.]|nr:hypothetical protein [Rhodopseudomonas sp.]